MTKTNKVNLICMLVALSSLCTVVSVCGIPGCRGEKGADGAGATNATATAEKKIPLFQRQEFRQELAKQRRERVEKIVIPYNQVRVRLEALIAQARAELPAGASDEQVKTELDGNPEKYPEWARLYARAEELAAQDKKSRTEAFAALGRRLRAEMGGNK